tara:strand:+ start:266 stop:547 length:282 start_codon:yes stop_codon:yes gene_type:complete
MKINDWAVDQLQRASFEHQHEAIEKAQKIFSKQLVSKTFVLKRAVDYIDYSVVAPAARKYAMHFTTLEDAWCAWFPSSMRKQVAKNIINSMNF